MLEQQALVTAHIGGCASLTSTVVQLILLICPKAERNKLAGQGYIWLAHRNPASASWNLALRSKALWGDYLSSNTSLCRAANWQVRLQRLQECNYADCHGLIMLNIADCAWQENGSILLGSTGAEWEELSQRHAQLGLAGIQAQLLDHRELSVLEPALACTPSTAGLLVPGDAQLVSPAHSRLFSG